ncbi:MAG: organic solvent tolerance protein OstA, partial [Rubripirellula sp.]
DSWFIHDDGLDTLGRDRQNLVPETKSRGRSLLRHKHYLGPNRELTAEIGWISDRNFLDQYLENEWDQDVDHRTGLRYQHYKNSHLFDISAYGRVNDFYTVTEQFPRLDHYLLGGSLLGDRLTLSGHSKVGYERLRVGDLPEDPDEAALYSPVPGEVESSGVVASTRQELSMPVQLGTVRVVPSISGEAAHYGEASDGEPLTRLLGQAGITASLSAWRADPSVQSALLNIRGLAHKVEWTAGYFYADSDTNLDAIPLYDPLDDNAQEQFRSRFITEEFGGFLPAQYDPRTYAFRQGFQRLVASPSDVIADDLQQVNLGLHQRWQTKRGLPGRERIVDLLQLDFDLLFFPKQDRDNFGEQLGPATYNMLYHVGDRVTLLSDGYFDFFDNGLRSISAGVRSSRPGVGDVYLGLLSLEGPISSTVLRGSVDYRLNEKWIASAGTTYDFGFTGNIGQTLAITRIGESMLLRVGVNVDEGRDNVGFGFSIEPRFWPRPKLGRIGGQLIPPTGVEGLE